MAPSGSKGRDRSNRSDPSSETPRSSADSLGDLWDEAAQEEAGIELSPRKRKGWFASWKQRRSLQRDQAPSSPPEEDRGLLRSPLFLGLTGGLVVLSVAALVLFLLIRRNRAQVVLDAASEAMQNGSYAQALSDYDHFLKSFPRHEQVPLARVQRGLCAIYRYTEGSSPSWINGFGEAEDLVAQVGDLPQFQPHRQQFGNVVGRIAVGLAEVSRAKVDLQAAQRAREALGLLEDTVPEEIRPSGDVEKAEQILVEAKEALQREADYTTVLAEMKDDLAAGDFLSVYRRRRELALRWPSLAEESDVAAFTDEALQQERDAVQFVASNTPAEHAPRQPRHAAAVTLAHTVYRAEAEAAVREGAVVYVQVADAMHAVRAATGQVLWRRIVGYDPPFLPLSLTAAGKQVTLLADTMHNELVLVDRQTQELVWRHTLDEPILSAPRVARNRLYQPLRSGRVLEFDLNTGRLEGEFRFPQAVHLTPLADPTGLFLSILAQRDTLYLISLNDRRSTASLYLGHDEGSLAAPMASVQPFQVLCENDRADSCLLRVIAISGKQATLSQVQSYRLEGWVHDPPILRDHRLFVTTDRGRLYAFSLTPREAEEPLILDAQTGDATEYGGTPFVVARTHREAWVIAGQFDQWVLNEPQRRFEGVRGSSSDRTTVAGALGPLEFSWWQPIQTLGDNVFFATRSADRPGVLMTAVTLKDEQVRWQITLGAGLAELSTSADQGVLTALTRKGDLFRLTADDMSGSKVLQAPFASLPRERGLEEQIWHGDVTLNQRLYWSAHEPRKLFFRQSAPTGQSTSFSGRTLPFELSAQPALFQNGILAPGPDGLLAWLDLPGLKPLAQPFQAPYEVARPPRWRSVSVVSDESILAADRNGVLYRVEVADAPVRHLVGESVQTLPGPLRSRIVRKEGALYLVDGNRTVWAFSTDGRNELGRWPLAGSLTGDLMSAGSYVFAREQSGALHCFDAAGGKLWTAGLPEGPLVGRPRVVGGRQLLLAFEQGLILAMDLSDGGRAWTLETGQTLESGPEPMGKRLAVGAADGTLLLYTIPRQ